MTAQHDPELPPDRRTEPASARTWVKPRLVAYGPISKLTQGGTGAKADGLVNMRP